MVSEKKIINIFILSIIIMKSKGNLLAFTPKGGNNVNIGNVIDPDKNMIYKQIHSYAVSIPQYEPEDMERTPIIKEKTPKEKQDELNELMELYYRVNIDKYKNAGIIQPAFESSPYSNNFNYINNTTLTKQSDIAEAVDETMDDILKTVDDNIKGMLTTVPNIQPEKPKRKVRGKGRKFIVRGKKDETQESPEEPLTRTPSERAKAQEKTNLRGSAMESQSIIDYFNVSKPKKPSKTSKTTQQNIDNIFSSSKPTQEEQEVEAEQPLFSF